MLCDAGDRTCALLSHRRDRPLETFRQPLTGELVHKWLRIKQIHVAQATLHEQKNHAFGPWREVRSQEGRLLRLAKRIVPGQQTTQRHRTKTGPATEQPIAPGKRPTQIMFTGIHRQSTYRNPLALSNTWQYSASAA